MSTSVGPPACCRFPFLHLAVRSTCSDHTSIWASSISVCSSPGSPQPFDLPVLILPWCSTANKVRRRPPWRESRRLLVDPHCTPLLSEPASTRDLMVTALNNRVLAFDNLGNLPGWLSDCFCRLATGGGHAARSFVTDSQVAYIQAERPIILNGIDEFVKRGDLIDRSVFLHLSPIHPSDRRMESELWTSFQFDYPRILGSLLDAVVLGMRILPSVELPEVSRMADFAYWGEAVGRGLGWPEHSFRSAYARNRRAATDSSIDDSAVAEALFRSVPSSLKWTGSTTELHRQLTANVGRTTALSSRWPKHVSRFSVEVRRLAPQLRERGLAITFSRSRDQRLITLAYDNDWLFRRPHRDHRGS